MDYVALKCADTAQVYAWCLLVGMFLCCSRCKSLTPSLTLPPAPSLPLFPPSQQHHLELTGHACLQEKRAREEMLQKQSIREQIWKKESPTKVPVHEFGFVSLACRLRV